MTMQGRFVAFALPITLLVGASIFGGHGWLQEHDARLKAESQTSQQQRLIEGLQHQQAMNQQALAVKLSVLKQARSRPATAAQIVDAARLLPNLPKPLEVKSVPDNPGLPTGPATQTVTIPEVDFKGIRDAQLTCDENGVKLNACESSQQNTSQQLKLTEAQRDEWKTTAKGGSIWHRMIGAAKWFAIGAGSGAVVYAVAHHK